MEKDFEKKLAALREDYKNHLPEKIDAIEKSWNSLSTEPNADTLKDFKFKIHGVHGSAATYGYVDLSTIAGKIEVLLSPAEDKLSDVASKEIQTLLLELKKTIPSSSTEKELPVIKKEVKKEPGQKAIYFLLNNEEDNKNYSKEAEAFGYKTEIFYSLYSFTKALTDHHADILVIDMDFVLDFSEAEAKELNEKYIKKTPILFISRSGNFSFRLKAVQLNGQAFFTKPFLFSELINEITRILGLKNKDYRVLIIDDDAAVANLYSTVLTEAGMMTKIILHAKEIEKDLHEFLPDLILTDFHMPECDGVQLATIIRQQKNFDSIPIIFLSSEEDKSKQINAMSAGADDFITKSTSHEYLILSIINKANRYKKLRELMTKDNLTGLLNHQDILHQLDVAIQEAKNSSKKYSIALLSIDNFKNIIDAYGHAASDQILHALSMILHNRLPNAIAGRFGVNEFLVILPDTDSASAQSMIDELRNQFSSVSYWYDTRMFVATFTAGIVMLTGKENGLEVIKVIKESMDRVKQNSVVVA